MNLSASDEHSSGTGDGPAVKPTVFPLRNRHGVDGVQQASQAPLVNGRYRLVSGNPRLRLKQRECHVSPPSRFHGCDRVRTRQDSVCEGLVVARSAQDNTLGRPPESGVVPWSGALIPAKPAI